MACCFTVVYFLVDEVFRVVFPEFCLGVFGSSWPDEGGFPLLASVLGGRFAFCGSVHHRGFNLIKPSKKKEEERWGVATWSWDLRTEPDLGYVADKR